jgi:hypothetical protein
MKSTKQTTLAGVLPASESNYRQNGVFSFAAMLA